MFLLLALIAAAPTAEVSQSAPQAPPQAARFGAASDIVWTSGTALRFNAQAPMVASRPAATATAATPGADFAGEAVLSLAVDYFVAKNLSVGGFVSGNYAWSPVSYGPGFAVGPRIGYVIAMSDWAALWPRVDLSFGAQGTFARALPMPAGMAEGMLYTFNAQVNLPLVFTLFQHVLLGIGPYFSFEPQWLAGQGGLQAFALNFGLATFIGLHY